MHGARPYQSAAARRFHRVARTVGLPEEGNCLRTEMPRAAIEPILHAIPAARQQAARHYGVHPYFTRRPANVVRKYIEHYSREAETVLDPYGGTGVTAIEAFLAGRRAIHNDINPFANFLARTVADTGLSTTQPLREAFSRIEGARGQPGRIKHLQHLPL